MKIYDEQFLVFATEMAISMSVNALNAGVYKSDCSKYAIRISDEIVYDEPHPAKVNACRVTTAKNLKYNDAELMFIEFDKSVLLLYPNDHKYSYLFFLILYCKAIYELDGNLVEADKTALAFCLDKSEIYGLVIMDIYLGFSRMVYLADTEMNQNRLSRLMDVIDKV